MGKERTERKHENSNLLETKKPILGQRELREKVLDCGLCTNCGACVNLCPYSASYKDNLIIIDQCDRAEGRCYAFCPRTPTDLQALRQNLFDPGDWIPELGPLKGFYMTRASDEKARSAAQHGGTVTVLKKSQRTQRAGWGQIRKLITL